MFFELLNPKGQKSQDRVRIAWSCKRAPTYVGVVVFDPTQKDGQGPDMGPQYRSAVFFLDEEQKNTALDLIETLKKKDYPVATEVLPASVFWKAEEDHKDYYEKTNKAPYCHGYIKRF